MIKIYELEELKEKNYDGYLKAIRWLRKNVGGTSDEALIRYAREAGYKASKEGVLYEGKY